MKNTMVKVGLHSSGQSSHLTIPFQRPLLRKLNLMHEKILWSTFFSGRNDDDDKIFFNKTFILFQVKNDYVA